MESRQEQPITLPDNFDEMQPAERLKWVHTAIAEDDTKMLTMLSSRTRKLRLEPEPVKDSSFYDWPDQFCRFKSPYYRHIFDTDKIPDASGDIAYDNALLAAANRQKLKAFEWILDAIAATAEERSDAPNIEPIDVSESLLKRLYKMVETRQELKKFLIDRLANLLCKELPTSETQSRYELEDYYYASKEIKSAAFNIALQRNPNQVFKTLTTPGPYYICKHLTHMFAEFLHDHNPAMEAFLVICLQSDCHWYGPHQQFQAMLTFACLASKTRQNITVSDEEIQACINSLSPLHQLPDEHLSADKFISELILRRDNAILFARKIKVSCFEKTPEDLLMLSIKFNALNIFKYLYSDKAGHVSNDKTWAKLRTASENCPEIKKYLSSFYTNPACEHKHHFTVFSHGTEKVRAPDGKKYKAILLEEASDSSEDESYRATIK